MTSTYSYQMTFGDMDGHAGRVNASTSAGIKVHVGGRTYETSPVFDTYWRFAAKRHEIYESRLAGAQGPWTSDPILRSHRFTNCFRAADRVSQYLINQVAYAGSQATDDLVFRVLLFKMFNRISTWELLECTFGELSLANFNIQEFSALLDAAFARKERLYSAAYVIPPPALGAVRKHTNHLRLLQRMMDDGLPEMLVQSQSMEEAYFLLRSFPAMGNFLAFQFLIDLNYTQALQFDEMDYVVAGPGARDGIRKCFGPESAGHETELIEYMAASQAEHFDRLDLHFNGLFGRPLQLIDCQNLFCEVDKYARVAHPDVGGLSGRTRIKQRFTASEGMMMAQFPPKWGLAIPGQALHSPT